jgi:hypothetical protein
MTNGLWLVVAIGGAAAIGFLVIVAVAPRLLSRHRARLLGLLEEAEKNLGAEIERRSIGASSNGPILRFEYRAQVGRLDFFWPGLRTSSFLPWIPRPAQLPGLENDLPATRLRFFLSPPPAQEILLSSRSGATEGSPRVRVLIDELRALPITRDVEIVLHPQGLFVQKFSWPRDAAFLADFITLSCRLADAYLASDL